VNLELTEEQSRLSDTFARFFKENSSTDRVRQSEPLGYDPKLWQQLVELGTPATRVAEEHGGLSMSLREITLITYQAGYHIASAPVVECAVAAKILSDVASEAAIDWLGRITSGRSIVSLALQPVSFAEQQIISSGAIADAVIALDGNDLVLVATEQKGEHAANLGSQPIARWNLKGTHRTVLRTGDSAKAIYEAAREEWKLLATAQMTGICTRALENAAEYSNERTAFGVKIGTFQGLSHPLADCATANDGAKLLNEYAIWKLERGDSDAAAHVAMAYWWATEACTMTMPQCVHIFGGYGVSEEEDIQLYARRGIALTSSMGDRQQELLVIAQRLWGGESVHTPEAGLNFIDFDLGESAEAMRQRAVRFFDDNLTEEFEPYRGHSWDGYHPAMHKKLADANLLFPQWPEKWGGLDATPAETLALQQVFYDRRWAQFPQGTSKIVGEMILKFGSDEVKEKILPEIMKGEAICCLGLTEPHCGSDVFAAKTKAVRKGTKWIIDGQKMFTSGANISKYVMLLTNTNPDAPKHVGKTLFIVPLDLPGVEIHRVDTISEDRTNTTYYTDVEIGDEYRLGDVDAGSKVMGFMLTLEQGGSPFGYELKHMIDQASSWALKTERNGKRVFDDPLAQTRLAVAATQVAIAETMLLRITEQKEKGKHVRHYASMLKSFVTEAGKKSGAELINMAAPDSLFSHTPDLNYIEGSWRSALACSIYAGTTQVHRSVVAENGLGMPRSR
jgi:alkylation response protein AidB-like acyl-CoA dehydrogenase